MTAERPIRWGILGAGRIAGKFAKGLAILNDAELHAVASRDRARGAAFAAKHGIPRIHSSYESLVADPDVDVVYVATLNVSHHSDTLLCVEAGKPVLCEKPFMMTAAETRDVIAAARARRVFCMEAMWMRFVPLSHALRARLALGIVGEVRAVRANLGFSAPFDPQSRLFDKQLGGGALLDLGVYPLSFIHMILGAPYSVSAHATLGTTGVDEHVTAQLSFTSGVQATLETSIVSQLPGDAVVEGSQGSIHVSGPLFCPTVLTYRPPVVEEAAEISMGSKMKMWLAAARRMTGAGPRHTYPVLGNGYAHQAVEVMRCLRANQLESATMPLDASLRVMETMDAVRAAWQGKGEIVVERRG